MCLIKFNGSKFKIHAQGHKESAFCLNTLCNLDQDWEGLSPFLARNFKTVLCSLCSSLFGNSTIQNNSRNHEKIQGILKLVTIEGLIDLTDASPQL